MPFLRALALIVFAIPSSAVYADEGKVSRAHYLANAGVMIARGDMKILFDPFFRNDYGQYDLVPAALEADLFAGTPPWDGVDAIFISHHHDDHFDPVLLARFLLQWPEIELYAPKQAADALLALDELRSEPVQARIHSIALQRDSEAAQLNMKGLLIEAVRIAHGGWPNRHADVENIVFRVTLDDATTVMHLGDADGGEEHYVPHHSFWQERRTDLALLPVWLLLTDKGRYALDKYVDAEHEIGVHVYKSVPDKPEERGPAFEGLDIFTAPGETRVLE